MLTGFTRENRRLNDIAEVKIFQNKVTEVYTGNRFDRSGFCYIEGNIF